MIWKDYIYFSRSERNGIKILSLLLIVIACSPDIIQLFSPGKPVDNDGFIEATIAFEKQLEELAHKQTMASHERISAFDPGKEPEVKLQPVRFNPNKLSVGEWEKMGLPARLARAVTNYLAAGGTFRVREDLKRIYLMQDEWYNQLEPFIDLPSKDDRLAGTSSSNQYQRENRLTGTSSSNQYRQEDRLAGASSSNQHRQESRDLSPDRYNRGFNDLPLIDINRADTTELTKIRGIGMVYSRRIYGYRKLLGGFYHPAQLLEVYGMDTARWEQLLPQTIIDTAAITKINLIQADYATLLRHPYIDRNLAGALVNFRDQHSPLDSLARIKDSFLITDQVYERIAPYLTVD